MNVCEGSCRAGGSRLRALFLDFGAREKRPGDEVVVRREVTERVACENFFHVGGSAAKIFPELA